ncbi:MHYT domain-containing protein [Nocardia sp. NPDC055321]
MIYFSMGYWVIGLTLIVSVAGAACGLACIRQSTKSVTARFRLVWLFVAASSIGGVGVALSVFVSMLGFEVKGGQIRYDTTLTTLFSALSGFVVFAALIIAGKTLSWWRIAVGALVMAAGLGTVHLLLLSAIRIRGTIDRGLVSIIAVYVIAALMSGLLLWFMLWAQSVPVLLAGSLAYAIMVTGMHYAGLTGLTAHLDGSAVMPDGDELFNFFVPFFIIGSLSLAIPITAILVAPDRREARQQSAPADQDLAHSPSLAVASRQSGPRSVLPH